MATQLKPSDFTYAAPTPRPNIRVVFNAGPAALAVREQADQLPADIRDATLDEITSDPVAEWDAACAKMEEAISARDTYFNKTMQPANELYKQARDAGLDIAGVLAYVSRCEDEYGVLVRAVDLAIESVVLIPAPDASGLAYKIKAFVGQECHVCEGYETSFEALVADATALTASPVSPFMRGPMIAWEKGYASFTEARRERLSYERAYYNPAGTSVSTEMQDHYDELVVQEGEALDLLLKLTAPSENELAIKLKLIAAGEEWRLVQDRTITAKIAADARRFGRHGAYLQSDAELLVAFAACRAEMVSYQESGPQTREEDDAADERVLKHEAVIHASQASTLEGVIAKLRLSFQHTVGEAWSDRAVADPAEAEFRAGLAGAGAFHQLLWSSVEDLARIAGVNLSEQGA
ncbi:hypothetical protein HRV97_03295 [Sphingomonas sp. HHU CXW]|uniref:Uncharacterized protein n=1 Tax=Sphingomonas hominis TaxID=2741495 RepID=A0ABX2JIB7_9SPHN|nr:hypothetical protein [Sphingomonas hominis]NTS64187.1 hypothetical protein [Sphingomonas hominis]